MNASFSPATAFINARLVDPEAGVILDGGVLVEDGVIVEVPVAGLIDHRDDGPGFNSPPAAH